MKKLSEFKFSFTAFLIVICILIAVNVIIYIYAEKQNEDDQRVVHTFRVMKLLEKIESLSKDLETGKRGFVITKNEEFLEPYHSAKETIFKKVQELRELTSGIPKQQKNVDTLETLIANHLRYIDKIIHSRRTEDFSKTQEIVMSGEGKAIMDSERILIDKMMTEEERLLAMRSARAQHDNQMIVYFITAGSFFSILLFGLIYIFLRKEIKVRLRSEKIQRQLSDKLTIATGSANIGIWEYDIKTGQIIWDKIVYKIFGSDIDNGENPSEIWERTVHPDDLKRVEQNFNEAIKDKKNVQLVFRIILPGGTVRYIESFGTFTSSTEGESDRMIGMNRDITESKLAEDRLIEAKEKAEEATRVKSSFLANMSHEIRTPMNAIIGFTFLALKENITPKLRDYLNKIDVSAKALLNLINDILDFSKIESGEIKFEHTDFDLEKVFSAAANYISIKAEEKGLELLTRINPDIPLNLVGDPGRLTQVITNLAGNAIKFTEKGSIVLSADLESILDDKYIIKFSVIDTGVGIKKDQFDSIFKEFSQADSSITRKYGGTGLGLTISKRIVEKMNGKIWVESEYGKGTAFYFTVQFDKPSEVKKRQYNLDSDLKGLTALVCDDNEIARDILKEALEVLSFNVSTASSGKEAIEMVEKKGVNFDLILMDFNMPELDGLKTSEIILKSDKLTQKPPKIIMVSSDKSDELVAKAEEIGISTFLQKPVNFSGLFDAIMDAFGKKENGIGDTHYATNIMDKRLKKIEGALLLLVEDNRINQQVAAELLKSAGFEVDIAADGKQAVEMVKNSGIPSKYVLVLMDLRMPVMDGFVATKEIRKTKGYEDLVIIAMTADATKEVRDECLAAGMNDFITKPVEPEKVFNIIVRYVEENYLILEKSGQDVPQKSKRNIEKGIDELENIYGMDLDAALKIVGSNRKFLIGLLGDFYEDNIRLIEQVEDAAEAGDRAYAHRLLHTLKGTAANLGFTTLAALAGQAEKYFLGDEFGDFNPALKKLGDELYQVLKSLYKTLDFSSSPAELLSQKISELKNYLKENNSEAVSVLDELREFSNRIENFDLLEHSITSYDYQKALKILETLKIK